MYFFISERQITFIRIFFKFYSLFSAYKNQTLKFPTEEFNFEAVLQVVEMPLPSATLLTPKVYMQKEITSIFHLLSHIQAQMTSYSPSNNYESR